MAGLPVRKVALLVGATEYAVGSGCETLSRVKDHLLSVQAKLEDAGVQCETVLSTPDANTTRADLERALVTQLQRLLSRGDPQETLAVVYCTGHGVSNGLMAAGGEVVPLSALSEPLAGVRWAALLVDACRVQGAAGGPQGFAVGFTTRSHYLIGSSCSDGEAAWADGETYTDHLLRQITRTTSVYDAVAEAARLTTAAGRQVSTTTCSGGGEEEFRRFSFHRPLRVGNLFLNRSPPAMVGREGELQRVREALADPSTRLCVVEGGPGEGKSLLAERAGLQLYRQGRLPAGAYRVDMRGCSASGALQHAAAQLVLQLKRAGVLEPSDPDTWASVLKWLLREHEAALILLENAEAASKELPYLVEQLRASSHTVAVLAASRFRGLLPGREGGGAAPTVQLDGLPPDAAMQLLSQQLPGAPRGDQERLARFCQGPRNGANPHMLVFVAALVRTGRCSVENVLGAAGGRPGAALEGSRLPPPVLDAMWQEQQRGWWKGVLGEFLQPHELEALAELSVFPGAFSLEGAQAVAQRLGATGELLNDLQVLTVLQPVAGAAVAGYFALHPLHREVAGRLLAERGPALQQVWARFVDHVWSLAAVLEPLTPAQALGTIQAEGASIKEATRLAGPRTGFPTERTASLAASMHNLALELQRCGQLHSAEPLYREALGIRQRVLGSKDHKTASTLNNLANLLSAQGELSEAQALYREALAIFREVLGSKDPTTASSLNNLAALLSAQGKLSEAEPLYREALAIRQEVLGTKHPDTASSLNNLAILLSDQGKLSEAEALYREALATFREVLGTKDPDTARTLNNLAILLRDQGKLSEAEPLCWEALAIFREVLGSKDPTTASSLNNLANLLSAQGKLSKAEPLYREALAIQQEVLGTKHPDTANSLDNLAILLRDQGKLSEAEPLCREALAIFQEVLGSKHRETARSLKNLATLLQAQGKLSEAEPLYREALAVFDEVLSSILTLPAFSTTWPFL